MTFVILSGGSEIVAAGLVEEFVEAGLELAALSDADMKDVVDAVRSILLR